MSIQDKGDKIITYGTDDSIKAAGVAKHDIKTSRLTLVSGDKKRITFSTGFVKNRSHKGEDSAKVVKFDLERLAILSGTTYQEIESLVDFFMTDRDHSSDAMLDELEISQDRRLKCNAHIVLAVENCVDKVLRDCETKLGRENLVGPGAAHVFNSTSSIWNLGLVALAKLLSTSHCKESISLYTSATRAF